MGNIKQSHAPKITNMLMSRKSSKKNIRSTNPGSGWSNNPSNYSEAGTPRDNSTAYANAPSLYLPSIPGGQPPMTPSSAYLPGTPGGHPMTPDSGSLDIMSPTVGSMFPMMAK